MARRRQVTIEEQGELIPNTEHPQAKEIAKLARKYVAIKADVYEPAREAMKEAKEHVLQAMKAAGLDTFHYRDIDVEVHEHEDTVKVRVGSEPRPQAERVAAE